ncbi:hypothetical protein BLOT_004341, partial [Blomia tropicalis]
MTDLMEKSTWRGIVIEEEIYNVKCACARFVYTRNKISVCAMAPKFVL